MKTNSGFMLIVETESLELVLIKSTFPDDVDAYFPLETEQKFGL